MLSVFCGNVTNETVLQAIAAEISIDASFLNYLIGPSIKDVQR
jgi:hypothetical protein